MFIFIIAMVVILALAVGVWAVVAIGMQGYYRDRFPDLAERLGKIGRHLDGEGEMPKALKELLPKRQN